MLETREHLLLCANDCYEHNAHDAIPSMPAAFFMMLSNTLQIILTEA